MIPHTNWEPDLAQIEWQQNMLRALKDVGTWCVPASASVFEINKRAKTFKLVSGDDGHEMNRRIAVVLRKLGYREHGCSTNRVKDFF
jgi:hypothetical protein